MNDLYNGLRGNVITPALIWALYVPWKFISLSILSFRLALDFSQVNSLLYSIGTLLLLLYIYKVIYIKMSIYEFGDSHLKITKGIFSITTDYLQYYRVKDYIKYRSLWMRILGVMKITLVSSDRTAPVLFLTGILNSNLVELIRETVENKRLQAGVYEIDQG